MVDTRLRAVSLSTQALGKIITGEQTPARELLDRAKALAPDEIGPYSLCADVHEQNGRFDKAMQEYEQYRQKNPTKQIPQVEIARLEMKAEAAKRQRAARLAPPPPPQVISNPQEIEQKLSGTKPKETKRPPKNQRNTKSHLIVNEDSVSFF